MATITVNLDDDVAGKFRKAAAIHFGKGKGHLKRALTEALERWMGREDDNAVSKALEVMRNSKARGPVLIKHREDVYDRYD